MKPTLGEFVRRSIELECTAPKLGNVYPGHPFEDMNHDTFLAAGSAIGHRIDRLYSDGDDKQNVAPGDAVLQCTRAMLESVDCNTSLGTILLVAPLIKSFARTLHAANAHGVSSEHWQRLLDEDVLQRLSSEDSRDVYEAIRLCSPGGLGATAEMDIASSPPVRLLDAMAFASSYDDVALQYVSRFELCFALAHRLSILSPGGDYAGTLDAITLLQLELLAARPDSLIARKGGKELAEEVRVRAAHVLRLSTRPSPDWREAWQDLDSWLRSLRSTKGKRLANPGTHADLIAAAILIHLLLQRIEAHTAP
ncbi:ATP:dephospho-CoA triphosphoribosyl transferase [Pirellula sp. SH-Sr6A]|uniref:triphosphoribosyl-dephospho-CoA synthase n=1 Tax=Pirellula sp. SH-Sr6A TaxID=1632865 RepID=UPI00078C6BAD|nr:triphosphoribosyl-dephospho-CoA synthase [Pirellula sp. SH-Sr6A]AMV32961.1 ATP:dephospho-CoA triphosphoribosyl transferase [Pirellula sp. SH-Sr6A]